MLRHGIFLTASLVGILSMSEMLWAASPFTGPVEAVIFDAPTSSFRAVRGTLGSAMLDAALLTGVDFGSVAPGQDYGVSFQSGQLALVSGFASGQPVTAAIAGTFSTPDGAAWSGDGTSVVLYSKQNSWLQLISGLPGAPFAASAVSTAPYGALAAVALDQTGQNTFAAITGSGVYRLTGSALSPVLPLAGAVALSVSDTRGVLYILDTASNQVYEWNLAALTSISWSVALVRSPMALLAAIDSTNTSHVYVAGAGSQSTLATYDADSHTLLSSVDLSFHPTALRALGAHSFVARDRQAEGEPLWTFAASETAVSSAAPACLPHLRFCGGVSRRAIRGGDAQEFASPASTTAASAAVYFIPATPLVSVGGVQ